MWDEFAVEAIRFARRGQSPWFLNPPFDSWDSARWLNSGGIVQRRSLPTLDLIRLATETKERLLAAVEALGDKEWTETKVAETSLGQHLQLNFSPPGGLPFRHFSGHLEVAAALRQLAQS